jgi:hypothetical protein
VKGLGLLGILKGSSVDCTDVEGPGLGLEVLLVFWVLSADTGPVVVLPLAVLPGTVLPGQQIKLVWLL